MKNIFEVLQNLRGILSFCFLDTYVISSQGISQSVKRTIRRIDAVIWIRPCSLRTARNCWSAAITCWMFWTTLTNSMSRSAPSSSNVSNTNIRNAKIRSRTSRNAKWAGTPYCVGRGRFLAPWLLFPALTSSTEYLMTTLVSTHAPMQCSSFFTKLISERLETHIFNYKVSIRNSIKKNGCHLIIYINVGKTAKLQENVSLQISDIHKNKIRNSFKGIHLKEFI